jgi:glycosyltransferase involved in cell wall biosynthesis
VKILSFTTLYPNAVRPTHGIFVENRLRHLRNTGQVEIKVMAPVPWFPFKSDLFDAYAKFARVPARETRHDIEILHPRFPLLPKIGMTSAPHLMYWATRPAMRRLIESGNDFDLIDAHYFYPDGVAAMMLGRHFGKPVTITARGTDINLIPEFPVPRRLIQDAASSASGLITVCQALKDRLVELGVASDRVRVLRNGVDLEMFTPIDRAAARARLGLTRTTILSVGFLIPRKGHDLIIGALPDLPGVELLIAGDGPDEAALRAHAERMGVADRVRFLGRLDHSELATYYGAADALVLASSREGWANVLLEAMACGTPVVATDIWGTPEVVAAPEAGLLMHERSSNGVADALRTLLADPPNRAATRAYAEKYSWDDPTEGQLRLFESILAEG